MNEQTSPDGIVLFKKRINIRRVNAAVRGLGFSDLVFSLFRGLFGVYGVGSWSSQDKTSACGAGSRGFESHRARFHPTSPVLQILLSVHVIAIVFVHVL